MFNSLNASNLISTPHSSLMCFFSFNSTKLPDQVNQRTQTKARSAETRTINKTKPPPLTTSTITSSSDVKVENVSPDTSPLHHHTGSDATVPDDDKTVSQYHNGIANRRARSDTNRQKGSRKLKKEAEDTAAVKAIAKSIPEKQKVSGYAARYCQQRKVAENCSKCVEKEMLNALKVLDFDRPLLSPATKESMAKKRRCSEKLGSAESSSQERGTTATSVSAPVRRSKQSGSLGSGEILVLEVVYAMVFYLW